MATNNASQADFLGEGTAASAFAPAGGAPFVSPGDRPNPNNPGGISDNELRRREQALLQGSNTAAAGRQNLLDSGQKTRAEAPGKFGTSSTVASQGNTANYDSNVFKDIGKIWTSDPVTTSVLAAPYAVGAAGALIPAAMGGVGGASAIPGTAATTGAASQAAASTAAAQAAGAGGAAGAGAAGAGGAAAGGAAAGAAAPAAAAAANNWLTPANAIGLAGLAVDVGGIVASQIRTKAEKALIQKQKELAAAAKARQLQVQREGMNRLGQQIQGFIPLNKAMAEMYGPDAAFSGQQMGALAADPGANQTDPIRMADDQRRQAQVAAAFGPAPQGPAPLQRRTPQAARRF